MAGGKSLQRTFTGVFAFTANEDLRPKTKELSDSYGNRLREVCSGHCPRSHVPDAVVVADEHVLCRREYENQPDGPRFVVYRLPAVYQEHNPAVYQEHNVAVQGFLALLFGKIGLAEVEDDSGRFFFPRDLPNRVIQVFYQPDQPWPNPNG